MTSSPSCVRHCLPSAPHFVRRSSANQLWRGEDTCECGADDSLGWKQHRLMTIESEQSDGRRRRGAPPHMTDQLLCHCEWLQADEQSAPKAQDKTRLCERALICVRHRFNSTSLRRPLVSGSLLGDATSGLLRVVFVISTPHC